MGFLSGMKSFLLYECFALNSKCGYNVCYGRLDSTMLFVEKPLCSGFAPHQSLLLATLARLPTYKLEWPKEYVESKG